MIKKLFSKLGVVFFLVTFLFSTCNVNVITYADDTGMRDISGLDFVKDMKVGWNLGNTFDAGNETDWGNPVTTHAMIDEIKKEGFNTLRLPVSWYKHIGSAPTYTIDSAYMSRVEEVVKYAFDNNMYVILNIHHDNTWIVPTYAHEAQTEDELTKVWTQIANHFQSYNDHLVFEAMNEPRPVGASNEWSGGSYENRDVINKFNATAVKAIRATGGNNTKRFIMVPTIAASDQSVALNDFVLPNDSRLIVSLHMYTPYYFAMAINIAGSTSTWGSDSDKGAMDAELDVAYNKFVKNGQAVVIGEFGSINKSNESSRVAHAKYFAQAATSRGMTPVWWDNGIVTANVEETYAIFNRNALSWYFPDIAKAFVDGATAGYGSGTIIGGTGEVVNGVIDDFEGYNGDNSTLRSKYLPVTDGGASTVTLDTANKNGGSNGLKFDYDVTSKTYCGVNKNITADARQYTGLSFWVKPDNNDRDVTVQFRESSGEYWETTIKVSGVTGSTIYVPFSSFKVPAWYLSTGGQGNGIFDLDALNQFNFYIGQSSGPAGTGTYYFDDFKLVNQSAVTKYGDVNGDGRINVLDYLLVKKYISGVITKFPSSNGLKAADVNGDGKVDNNDYVLIRSYLIHQITKFAVQN